MPPIRYRVLVVDPVKLRRDRATAATRLRFDIVGAGTVTEALSLLDDSIHAIVITLKQIDENGLVVGRKLREKAPGAFILVHGPVTPAKSAEERAPLAQHHKVDLWLGSALDADGFEAALWSELERRFNKREKVVGEPSWGELLQAPASLENVKKLLTKDLGGPIPTKIRRA